MRKLAILAAFIAAAAASSWATAARGEETITLGCAISLNGPLRHSGGLYRRAYDLAVEWINGHGGVNAGGRRYRLEIRYYDDEGEEARCAALVEKLVKEDGAAFLLGPYGSALARSAAQVAGRLGVPMVQAGGTSPLVFQAGKGYVFGTLPDAGRYAATALEFMASLSPRPRSLALAWADDTFDRSFAAALRERARQTGMELVADETYSPGTDDFGPVLERIKSAGAEAVLLAGYEEESRAFIQQAKRQKVSAKLFCIGAGIMDSDFTKYLGILAETILGLSPWDGRLDLRGEVFGSAAEFVRAYQERYKEDPDFHAAAAAMAVAVIKEGIEAAGGPDRAKVRDAIAGTALDTVYGRVEFAPDGSLKGGVFVLQVQGGSAVQVYPAPGRKTVYPMPPWVEKKKKSQPGREP